MSSTCSTVICDHGSWEVKCGIGGDNLPRVTFPSAVRVSEATSVVTAHTADTDDPAGKTIRPIQHGIVEDWDAMGTLWDHAFSSQQLGIQPGSCKIMLTEPAFNPSATRHKTLEIMFEQYGFEAAFIHLQAALSLISRGIMTGLALDIGDGVSHTVPMVDGTPWVHACQRVNLAGAQITSYLVDLLLRRGVVLTSASDIGAATDMKHKLCYVSCDYRQDARLARETTALMKSYALPDGTTIRVGPERFMAPEALFNPSLCGVECKGVADIVFQSIQAMDINLRMPMYENIVVSGGSTALPGLPTRLDRELCNLYEEHILKSKESGKKPPVKILHVPSRKYMVFTGASMMAEFMKDSTTFWISKAEWKEDPHRAVAKCPGSANRKL